MSNSTYATAKLAALLTGLIGTGASVPATGCAAPQGGETTSAVPMFTNTDNGKKVTVNRDLTFEVSLEANASTGYQWNIVSQDKKMLESEGDPQFVTPKGAPPGTPSQQVFRFKAKKTGTSKLVLHYARPWEKDKKPAEGFSLQVTVK